MIPLRLYAYAAGTVAIAAGVLWYGHSRYEAGEAAGEAAVTAQWQADTKSRDATDARIRAENAAKVEAARVTNQEVLADANQKLIAIAADRDSLARRMQDAAYRLRAAASAQATDKLGIDVATGIAARAEEARRAIEQQWDAYDQSCRRDAVRMQALQEQIRPWL